MINQHTPIIKPVRNTPKTSERRIKNEESEEKDEQGGREKEERTYLAVANPCIRRDETCQTEVGPAVSLSYYTLVLL